MKKKLLALAMGIIMIISIGGCASSTQANENSEKISVIGSTTIQPLAESITSLLKTQKSDLIVEVQGNGSGPGIKSVIDGTANIGMVSRELKEDEKSQGIDEHIVAYDGIAVIVNPSNGVTDLTMEQVKKIFEGDIKNWKEIGGKDADIVVVSREAGSGTRGAFEELVKLTKTDENGKVVSSLKLDALVQEGNGAIEASVASKENAIGYMSEGYLNESVKALKIDNVECTVENIKSSNYKLSRPLLLVTKGELSTGTKAFIDCFLSDEGQKIVSEKYVTVK